MMIQSILTRNCKPHGQRLATSIKYQESAKIAKEKISEIFNLFPLLKEEIEKDNYGADYVTLYFKNGSIFDVVSALNSQRGGRRHGLRTSNIWPCHKTAELSGKPKS